MPDQYDMFIIGINLYAQITQWAVPIAFAFGMCNVIVNTVLSVAFGGKLKIGGGK